MRFGLVRRRSVRFVEHRKSWRAAVVLSLGQRTFVRQRAKPAQQLAVNLSKIAIWLCFELEGGGQCRYKTYLLTIVVLSVKGASLPALLARHWRPVLLLRVCAPLAFGSDKCGDYVAIFARRRLPVRLDVLLAFFTDGGRASLTVVVEVEQSGVGHRLYIIKQQDEWMRNLLFLLEFCPTICTFYDGKSSSAYLYGWSCKSWKFE